jgi:2-haloacid dehalogenase
MEDEATGIPLFSRRTMLAAGACGMASVSTKLAAAAPTIRALAFDAFPIFDPRSLAALARTMVGDRGDALSAQWSARLFGYTWLETAAGWYRGFAAIADSALRVTAEAMGIALSDRQRHILVSHYNELDVWPDVKPALQRLRDRGIRIVLLSNLSLASLQGNIRRNGLERYFEPPLSTDAVRRFKPSPMAYAMALDAFGLPKSEIGFAAFGGWDAVGARWFGYRTAWINRLGVPGEGLDMQPEVTSRGIEGALTLAGIA